MSDLRHIAIIMDGNGRWARKQGLPRVAGHHVGMNVLRKIVRHAAGRQLEWLTLFAFSSENWSRPQEEVNHLIGLLKLFIQRDLRELHNENIRIRVIGGRQHLAVEIRQMLEEAEALTCNNTGLNLVVAFNYGGRDEIVRAVTKIAVDVESGVLKSTEITQDRFETYLDTAGIPSPDLVIRTSGEQRLSNFLLWQAAYSELSFVDCYWPDFSPASLDHVIDDYNRRERRFGNICTTEVKKGIS